MLSNFLKRLCLSVPLHRSSIFSHLAFERWSWRMLIILLVDLRGIFSSAWLIKSLKIYVTLHRRLNFLSFLRSYSLLRSNYVIIVNNDQFSTFSLHLHLTTGKFFLFIPLVNYQFALTLLSYSFLHFALSFDHLLLSIYFWSWLFRSWDRVIILRRSNICLFFSSLSRIQAILWNLSIQHLSQLRVIPFFNGTRQCLVIKVNEINNSLWNLLWNLSMEEI
jgi:hypothetical protein